LHSLEQIGVVERRPGRGTRLRTHVDLELLALHGLIPFPTLLRELGHDVSVQVSWRRIAEANEELLARLGQTGTTPIYEIDITVHADGAPAVVMCERFAENNLAREPTDEDLHAGSILILSARCFQKKIDHAIASLRPQIPAPGNPLGLGVDRAMLVLDERFLSDEEELVAVSEVCIHPELITFSVFRRSF
jgi:DNA-binding GntR family transcriptional regulator